MVQELFDLLSALKAPFGPFQYIFVTCFIAMTVNVYIKP